MQVCLVSCGRCPSSVSYTHLMLAKKPEEYTAGEILRAAEGSLAPVGCIEDEPNACGHYEPVSYTQLDVFKRQHLKCGLGKINNTIKI